MYDGTSNPLFRSMLVLYSNYLTHTIFTNTTSINKTVALSSVVDQILSSTVKKTIDYSLVGDVAMS